MKVFQMDGFEVKVANISSCNIYVDVGRYSSKCTGVDFRFHIPFVLHYKVTCLHFASVHFMTVAVMSMLDSLLSGSIDMTAAELTMVPR